jgi:hypothetical protein
MWKRIDTLSKRTKIMGKEYSKSSMKDSKMSIFFFLWAVTTTIVLLYKIGMPSSEVLINKDDRRAVTVSYRDSKLQGEIYINVLDVECLMISIDNVLDIY